MLASEYLLGHGTIINRHTYLHIQIKTAHIHIHGTKQAIIVIHAQNLGM